jgi:hypothetical protein
MNFIAIIGIVDKMIKMQKDNLAIIKVKVEKPFIETQDEE